METASKHQPKKHTSSLSVTAKINLRESMGIGCAGWVTVDRVRTTDEWVQEAAMSDIFHQTSQSDKKKMPQQRQKDTGSPQALQTAGSVTEPAGSRQQEEFLFITY